MLKLLLKIKCFLGIHLMSLRSSIQYKNYKLETWECTNEGCKHVIQEKVMKDAT